MFITALFTTANKLEITQIYPSTGEYINKFWHSCTKKSDKKE